MIVHRKRREIQLLAVAAASFGFAVSPISWAQTASSDQLKSELLLGLMQPLPITIVGPLMASNLEVAEQGDVSSVTLENTMLMGALPLGDVSFDLQDLGNKRYKISNFNLPEMINLPDGMALKIGSSSLEGVWSFDTRSYETMSMNLNDVSLSVGSGSFELGSLENLNLKIDQQGKSNIEASSLAISANGLTATIPGQSVWNIGNVGVQVGTKTGEALDIHALLTQSIQAGLMSNDFDRLMGTLNFLRTRQYENLEIQISGRDVDIDIEDGSSIVKADTALVFLKGGSVSEQRIGDLEFIIDGRDWTLIAEDDVSFSALEVGNQIRIEELPLAQVLNAVAQIQLAMNGATVEAKISDLYDAFLGFNLVSVSARAVDLDTEFNEGGGKTSIKFDYAGYQAQLQGFRDLKGVVSANAKLEDLSFSLPEVKLTQDRYNSELGEFVEEKLDSEEMAEALAERALIERTIRLLAPTSFDVDAMVTGFGDKLIHKIYSAMQVDENLPTNLLAALAVIPTLEMATKSEVSYATEVASMNSSTEVSYVPMRLLSLNPYTGIQSISFNNWDAFVDEGLALITAFDADPEAIQVVTPIAAVLEGFGDRDGETINWALRFDGEKDYILVNDQKVFLGAILGMLTGPMMSAAAMGSIF